jgi:hypothetical protein
MRLGIQHAVPGIARCRPGEVQPNVVAGKRNGTGVQRDAIAGGTADRQSKQLRPVGTDAEYESRVAVAVDLDNRRSARDVGRCGGGIDGDALGDRGQVAGRVIVPFTVNWMVEVPTSAFAATIAARSEPAPESFRLLTVIVDNGHSFPAAVALFVA